MNRRILVASTIVMMLLLSSCNSLNLLSPGSTDTSAAVQQQQQATQAENTSGTNTTAQPVVVDSGLLAAYENALTDIYEGVSPSVVSIRVVQQVNGSSQNGTFPNLPNSTQPFYAQGQGSGFVWDLQGHIITNNHVVQDATKIEVVFYDGTIVSAEVVGADAYSDLAVIKVGVSQDMLQPVQMANSEDVKVGQLAVAIGNPFGLENTMTVGIISGLGRSIPASDTNTTGLSYSIPDIIQTDAPINPGNSGGVLVNDQGQVIGVTAAIESPVGANAGIGYAIPANIVSNVVPGLIENGVFEHPYLGISGTSLIPELATAMDLAPQQRGALVVEVTPNTPADTAGLIGSDRQITVDGQDYVVGGDVIVAINGVTIRQMDDLISYLYSHTSVGQDVTLSILRDGKAMDVSVTLQARPAEQAQSQQSVQQGSSGVYLGVTGRTVTPEIATAMDLPQDQSGVLVVQVSAGSPADKADLHGSFKPLTVNGEQIMVGGDIITAFDSHPLTSIQDLVSLVQHSQAGQKVDLTVLRDGETIHVEVTLALQSQQ